MDGEYEGRKDGSYLPLVLQKKDGEVSRSREN